MVDQANATDRQRIILLFDGTWNDSDIGENDTNIVRLREFINDDLQDERTKQARCPTHNPPIFSKTLVYYRRGVGTDGPLDKLLGGGLGLGVSDNVRRGYRFLARHYQPDDDVFIFGFSRGAFTARSLVGYLGAVGLLRDSWCTPERERAAWTHYRTAPDDRLPGDWHALGAFVHPRGTFRIRALCVFDTVGALGVPTTWLKAANRRRYEFHNVELPSITHLNLHAIAIDEQRRPFDAALWRRHKFKRLDHHQVTEQVWFPGVHADIGGGYIPGEGRKAGLKALDDIPLHWMLRRLKQHVGTIPVPNGLPWTPDESWSMATQHQSRDRRYQRWPPAHRAIANRPVELLDRQRPIGIHPRDTLVSIDRHQEVAEEMVHIAAIERLGRYVPCGAGAIRYAPPVLLARLEDIAHGAIGLVGWDGAPIAPAQAAEAVVAARARLAA